MVSIDDAINAVTVAREPFDAYVAKKGNILFDSECKELTRVFDDCEKCLIALYPFMELLVGKQLQYSVKQRFLQGWVSDDLDDIGLSSHKDIVIDGTPKSNGRFYGIPVWDRETREHLPIIACDPFSGKKSEVECSESLPLLIIYFGYETKVREVVQESKNYWWSKKPQVTKSYETYQSSDIRLYKIGKREPLVNLDGKMEMNFYSVWDFVELLIKGLYEREQNHWEIKDVLRTQAVACVDVFENLPKLLADAIAVDIMKSSERVKK